MVVKTLNIPKPTPNTSKKSNYSGLLISLILGILLLALVIVFAVYLLSKNDSNKTSFNSQTSTTIEPTKTITYIDNVAKWKLDYPSDWSYSEHVEGGLRNVLFNNSENQKINTEHNVFFSVKQNGGGLITSYNQCVEETNKGGDGSTTGHKLTIPEEFTISGYQGCRYTETVTDGVIKFVNIYNFIKDPTTGRTVSISYAEDNNNDERHNYDVKDWILKNTFETMLASFRFI